MNRLVFIILILISLIGNVHALGVASDYLENNTIVLIEGSSKLHNIEIQNPTESELKVKLTYDRNFISVRDYLEEYDIPPKSRHKITFNVSAPNAKPGKVYSVSYTVHQLTTTGPSVPIGLRIAKSFKLKIDKDPNKFYISNLYDYAPQALFLLLIALLLVLKNFGKFKKILRKRIK